MDSKKNELKVGIAVLVSLIILIGGIMWGKGYRLKVARYEIAVLFDNVSGLESGCNVLANGVVKGGVQKSAGKEGRGPVPAAGKKSVTLYPNSRIPIDPRAVGGGRFLALYPASNRPGGEVSNPLDGKPPLGMGEAVGIFQDISEDFRTALHHLNSLLVNLNVIVGDTLNQRHVSSLLTDASGAARTSNEWLRDNRDDLTDIVLRLKTTIEATELIMHTTEARLNTTLDGVDSTTAQITALSASLHTIAEQINREDGTLGKLLRDDELYQRLTGTLAQVDSLSEALRKKGLKHRITFF